MPKETTKAQFLDVNPVLPSKDVQAALSFYLDKLGFSLLHKDDETKPTYAAIYRDSVELHIQWHNPEEWHTVERPMLRFVIQDVKSLFEEYSKQNVFHNRTELRETPWRTREFAFYDLDQNGLTFYCDL